MRWRQIVRLKLRALFRRHAADRELEEELRYHFDREVAKNVAEGMSDQEAHYTARRAMGATEQRKEECRDSRGIGWLQDLLQDLRYAMRTLCKSPGFTLVAALVLSLAIGANTAVFTVVNAVLLRPLPFSEPDRLFLVSSVPKGLFFDPGPIMLDRDYLDFHQHNHSFESLAAIGARGVRTVTLTKQGEPAVLTASVVAPDLLRVLRVQPELGSAFLTDGQPDPNVVLLSNRLWISRFRANSQVIGSAITLDGASYTISGVMPPKFTFQNADLWMPLEVRADARRAFLFPVIGRLKPGVAPRQAQAELATFRRDASITRLLPLNDLFVAGVRKLLLIFAGAVGFVFLIACANFANLLLIRGTGRQLEMVVRAALGASRGRIMRQLITESTLLSLVGAALGVVLSTVGVRALVALLPPETIPYTEDLHVDLRVLLFAVGLALITGLLFGLAPAMQATRRDLSQGIRARRERLRGALITAEIALALVLLIGAGLLVNSFLQMRAVKPGFQSANVTVATVDLPHSRYKTAAQMQAFDQNVLSSLSSLPGVQSVAAVSFLPFGNGVRGTFYLRDGRQMPDEYRVDKPEISSDYFRTMGIKIVSGRGFTERDDPSAPAVAVVSDSVARRLWPAGDAVGKQIAVEEHAKAGDWLTVVGVASDVRQQGLTDKSSAVIYQPYRQIKQPGFINHMSFVVKSENPATAAAGLRTVIRHLDQDLPAESITTMDSILADSLTGARAQTRLLGIFSLLALVLATTGIYGVLACSVAERKHEIGIRMAVGAGRSDIFWMVMRRTLVMTGNGLVIGILGALAVTRVLIKFLFEVNPTDPATFLAVTAILIAVTSLSALIPAQRAARVYPVEALRHD